jgi:hypothetical protein
MSWALPMPPEASSSRGVSIPPQQTTWWRARTRRPRPCSERASIAVTVAPSLVVSSRLALACRTMVTLSALASVAR